MDNLHHDAQHATPHTAAATAGAVATGATPPGTEPRRGGSETAYCTKGTRTDQGLEVGHERISHKRDMIN